MLAIVVSEADRASAHIGEHLRRLEDWTTEHDHSRPASEGGGEVLRTDGVELRTFESIHIDLDGVAASFDDPDLLAFASRHAGETGELLTAHHTGNFGPAEFGGEDGHFARACPNAHRRVVHALSAHAPEGYEAGMECTHHGPTEIGVPSMFVEVGSDEPQWDDPAAAEAVARAILDLRDVAADAPREDGSRRHVVGFGGGHYVPRFERIVRETDWAVGHIAADWCLEDMGDPAQNRDVLERAFSASATEYAVVTGEHPDLVETIESMGYRVVGESWLRATTGVDLSFVDAIEDALGPVAEAAALGDPAVDYEGAFTVVDLPVGLCEQAQRVDADAARGVLQSHALAFETAEGGTRLGDRAALSTPDAYDRIVSGLVDLLTPAFESVEVTEDAVVARERTFDPEKARTLGISEGPAFGKLSAGQAVEVNGRRIDPDVVHVERERRFPLDRP